MADIVVSASIETNGALAGARSFNSALGTMRTSVGQTSRQFGDMNRSILTLRNSLIGLAGAWAVREVIQAGDAYSNLKARLQLVAGEGESAAGIMAGLNAAAARAKAPISDLTEVFTRNAQALRAMGRDSAEGIRLTETLSKVTAISGASAQQSSAAMMQLSQAIASGRFQGDEFRSVAENLPEIMRILQKETGKTAGELRKLASEGKLTGDVLVNALYNAAEEVDTKFQTLPDTVGRAWTRLTDVFSQTMGAAAEAGSATKSWANMLNELTTWLQSNDGISVFQTLANVVGLVGEGFGGAVHNIRRMAEESRLAAEQADKDALSWTSLWQSVKNAYNALNDKFNRVQEHYLPGTKARREQAEMNLNWQDATTVTRGDAVLAASPSGPKRKIEFGAGEDIEGAKNQEKRLARLRSELTKNLEVERLRAAVTRAEIDGNTTLAQTLRTQLEIRSRISEEARQADPAKAAALEEEIRLQNALEIQLRATQEVQERNAAFAQDFASTITNGMSRAVTEGGNLTGTLKNIGVELANVALKSAVFDPMQKSLSSLVGGGMNQGGFDIGSLFSSATTSGWTPTVTMFASGGIVDSPTMFGSGGKLGVAGEAGPEAILPLKRGADGSLGVSASGANSAPPVTFNVSIAGDATDETVAKMQAVAAMAVAKLSPGIVRESVTSVRREIVRDRNFLRR